MYSNLFKITLSFLLLNFFVSNISAGYDDGVSVYYYNGIPGCGCFRHCTCIPHDYRTPDTDSSCCIYPENKVWHLFVNEMINVKKHGPYITYNLSSLCKKLSILISSDLELLSDYLEAIEACKSIVDDAIEENILIGKSIYSSPRETIKLQEYIDNTQTKANKAKEIISTIPQIILPTYENIILKCPHKSSDNLALIYNEGLIGTIKGDFITSLDKINEFVFFAETSKQTERLINSKIYQLQGESYLEVGLYNEAIVALTKSIVKDPANTTAYFNRAAANFEVGNFDEAIQDYNISGYNQEVIIENKTSENFNNALIHGILNGCQEAALDFVPSLCNSAFGIGDCLWSFVQEPINSTTQFCNACYESGKAFEEYIQTIDKSKVEEMVVEMQQLYENFNNLNDAEKGNLIGHAIGKYGVDIFAGGVSLKCVSALKNLKKANRLANLEALCVSEKSKKIITSAASKHATERELFFEKAKIQWDKQNKHVPGSHNYQLGKSVFEHPNAEKLLKEHAGKGKIVRGSPGESGYQELIDFGEVIGYNVDLNGIKTTTTYGKIHYSKNGAHIVPTMPKK